MIHSRAVAAGVAVGLTAELLTGCAGRGAGPETVQPQALAEQRVADIGTMILSTAIGVLKDPRNGAVQVGGNRINNAGQVLGRDGYMPSVDDRAGTVATVFYDPIDEEGPRLFVSIDEWGKPTHNSLTVQYRVQEGSPLLTDAGEVTLADIETAAKSPSTLKLMSTDACSSYGNDKLATVHANATPDGTVFEFKSEADTCYYSEPDQPEITASPADRMYAPLAQRAEQIAFAAARQLTT